MSVRYIPHTRLVVTGVARAGQAIHWPRYVTVATEPLLLLIGGDGDYVDLVIAALHLIVDLFPRLFSDLLLLVIACCYLITPVTRSGVGPR